MNTDAQKKKTLENMLKLLSYTASLHGTAGATVVQNPDIIIMGYKEVFEVADSESRVSFFYLTPPL